MEGHGRSQRGQRQVAGIGSSLISGNEASLMGLSFSHCWLLPRQVPADLLTQEVVEVSGQDRQVPRVLLADDHRLGNVELLGQGFIGHPFQGRGEHREVLPC